MSIEWDFCNSKIRIRIGKIQKYVLFLQGSSGIAQCLVFKINISRLPFLLITVLDKSCLDYTVENVKPFTLDMYRHKSLDPVSNTPVCVHLQTERQQRQQGLFGGTSCELRQRLDQFVHHHAKVALQLLPPLLHKLGILQTNTNTEGRDKNQLVI